MRGTPPQSREFSKKDPSDFRPHIPPLTAVPSFPKAKKILPIPNIILPPSTNIPYCPMIDFTASAPAVAPAPKIAAPPRRFGMLLRNSPCCEKHGQIGNRSGGCGRMGHPGWTLPSGDLCVLDGLGCHGSCERRRGSSGPRG